MNLLPHQIKHAERIAAALSKHRVALDASDPGTGKTYVACAVAARLGYPVAIVSTKATIPSWSKVAAGFGLQPLLVVNYEKVRRGKLPECRAVGRRFEWNLPEDTLFILDECQKCKGRDSLNAKLLIAARSQHYRILLCSATAASNPLEMRAIGFALGLHALYDFWTWAKQHGVVEGLFGLQYEGGADCLKQLHKSIFPSRGSRMRIADIPNFPESTVEAAVLETGKTKAIQREYDAMRRELQAAERTGDSVTMSKLADQLDARSASPMTIMLRARQAVELHKVDAMAELARCGLEEGQSVAVFVNFSATIDALAEKLGCHDIICGGQDPGERQEIISRFQANLIPLVICNIQAGGVGVSLHDPTGTKPRLSIISPTFSAADLRQALGRVHRAGGAPCIQKICFAAGTCEERTAELCAEKLANIDLLNDGDMQPFPISIKQ